MRGRTRDADPLRGVSARGALPRRLRVEERFARRARGAAACAALLAVALSATPGRAASDAAPAGPFVFRGERVVTAGPHYARGPVGLRLLGTGWRSLWTTPIRVPVLDLERSAGGLVPLRTVGNLQTAGLALEGADGRSYTFRSTDKEVSRALGVARTVWPLRWAVDDMASAHHPGAPLVAAPLERAAGLLRTTPVLVVLPDDPRLDRFPVRFAGRLGTVAEFPTGAADGAGTFDASEIVDTEVLRRLAREDLRERPDAVAFLRARLVDFWLGDWDRHEGQWRWARLPGVSGWQPAPEDRDLAFVRYEGLIAATGRPLAPYLVQFDEETPLPGLVRTTQSLDRWILPALEREAWRAVARELVDAVGTEDVSAAVARLPDGWRDGSGPELEALLRRRRGDLPEVAQQYYAELARHVVLEGSAGDDVVEVVHETSGAVEVRMRAPDGALALRRRFLPAETETVDLRLLGGHDRVRVSGAAAAGVRVRRVGPCPHPPRRAHDRQAPVAPGGECAQPLHESAEPVHQRARSGLDVTSSSAPASAEE